MPLRPEPAELTLVDGDVQIVVRPVVPSHASPVLCREWNPGAPDVREQMTDRMGADGTIDATAFTGRRTVTLDLQVFGNEEGSAYQLLERLVAMTHPTHRPYLHVRRGGPLAESWRIALRGNPFSVSYGRKAATVLDLQLAFTAPDGYFESPVRSASSSGPAQRGTGLVFPVVYPLTFGTSGDAPTPLVVDVYSPMPIAPVLRIYGPAINPELITLGGLRFSFTSLTVNAGEYVEIDMGNATVRLNGQASTPVFHTVDWSVSTFWRLPPGSTIVQFLSTGGQLVISWRDRRLTA